jgi:hypothetical protein
VISSPASRLVVAVNRWWWPVTGSAIVIAWVGVALAHSTRFPPLAAAAAAGTALLAAAPLLPVAGLPGLTGVVAVLVLPVAVAEAARGGNAAPLGAVLGALAVMAVFAGARERGRSVPLTAMAFGVAGVVAGLTAGSADADRVRLAIADRPSAAVVLAGAALALAAIDERSKAERALVAPILLGALLAAPALPPWALLAGWGALAVGAALLERPSLALAAAAIVAAAAGAAPAAILLGAAAVLAAALDVRLAALLGLPGGVALAQWLLGRPATGRGVAAAAVVAAVALALAMRVRGGLRVDGGRPLALVLGAWLLVAPGSWAFAGVTGLGPYDVGASRALAAGLVVALVVVVRRGADLSLFGADGVTTVDGSNSPADRPVVAAIAATLATVASVGWLVVSVVRLH